jgi:ABC-type nitrate/sulfonate/bicarbonate transport system permease component
MKPKISHIISFAGVIFIPLIWIFCKEVLSVSDRFLPSIGATFSAIKDIEPNVFVHTAYTVSRLMVGMILGVFIGIALGIWLYYSTYIYSFLSPIIQSIRSIPPIATVPFFLLWFGFAEFGRYLLITLGIALNIAIATYQILQNMPEKYKILFKSFGINPRKRVLTYSLPVVLENIFPTVRFSLSTAIGLVIVSELLGSQVGLGYLIQTSRSTFSLHVIFLAVILLGIVNFVFDTLIRFLWKKMVYWQTKP